ncbi:MAG: tyrosine--tRNA ligase [Candidatus Delongbacteria bacterium]|jgi:tyrosyl-tRNA synthetase|nr:tyrosine--tRNA ligase [Candidatus Delongbacteria bacterium]
MLNLYSELKERGFIKQITVPEEKIENILNNEKISMYTGFDPTKESLHVGHLMPVMILSHLQRSGHRPICVVGGGTALVGDPSGKDSMREMLTDDKIQENLRGIKKQLSHFIDFNDEKALMVNNYDWLGNENYIDFIRTIGPHFTVNRMLAAECFKMRMEKGLSFLEFNYMIMQAYDFYVLSRKYECKMQIGGDDQWSNIIAGIELIRRIDSKEGIGVTCPLLTRSDGKKMGKTEGGAVWLNPEWTTPYEYYQYWRNSTDEDVLIFMKLYTFIPLDQINKFTSFEGVELNEAKELLAYETTKLLHGTENADKARESAKNIFLKGGSEGAPSIELDKDQVIDQLVVDVAVSAKLFESKGEARRMIKQGGLSIDDKKINDINATINSEAINKTELMFKKGKKTFLLVKIK